MINEQTLENAEHLVRLIKAAIGKADAPPPDYLNTEGVEVKIGRTDAIASLADQILKAADEEALSLKGSKA